MFVVHRRLAFIATALMLIPLSSFGQDRVIMKNGDVITGNVSKIVDDEVFIEPAYADEFSVDLAEVDAIEAAQSFEVELTDERKLDGSISVGPGGQQVLVTETGEVPFTLSEIARAEEPESYFDWGANADFNATTNSGNTNSKNTLMFLNGNAKWGDHRHLGDLTFRREETDNVSTKKQDLLNYAYNWLFSEPWYMGGTFTWERDPIRDLEHRYTLGLIIGRDIFDDADRFLSIYGGVGYSDEEIGGVAESGSVGIWNLNYTQTFWGNVDFFHNHKLTQQFYGVDNLIFKSNTGFRLDIIDDLYANLSLRYDYETEPAAGASKDDQTLSIGVGYSF